MVEVTLVKLLNDMPFKYDFLPFISDERKKRIEKYNNDADKKRSLITELLIRKEASENLRIPLRKIIVSRNPYGKPYIDNIRNFKFNVTHSVSYVAIATSKYSVGIDIEKIKKIDIAIAKRFFTKNEYFYIKSYMKEFDQMSAFYMLWTLKESYVKAIGKGLHLPFRSFEFDFKNGIHVNTHNENTKYQFTLTRVNDYVMSVCYQDATIKYTYLNEVDIYNYYKNKIAMDSCK